MGWFSRRRAAESDTPAVAEEPELPAQSDHFDLGQGPYDLKEVPEAISGKLIDLGALRIPAVKGLQVRLENGKPGAGSQAAVLVLEGSSLELRVFAAPRSTGIWAELCSDITAELEKSGASPQEITGSHGVEILAHLPMQGENGAGTVPVRFVGVDGPRWFLRGVYNGRAATDAEAASALENIFNNTVVVRGSEAKPPREPLELRAPNVKKTVSKEKIITPLEPGPTIAEVR